MSSLTLTVGARGSGKSTLARADTRRCYRRVILDPSGDWQRRGVRALRDLPQLARAMALHWHRGFDYVLVPPSGKESVALHYLSEMLVSLQEQVYRGKPSQETMLVVDEMAEAYSNADAMRPALSGFRRVILQGRHFGISVYGITQRPQDVAARYRDNCDQVNAFVLHGDAGRDAVAAMLGRAHAGAYLSLRQFEYLAKDGLTGAVRKLKTRRD